MPDLERYYDEIDAARIRRMRELLEIKYRFTSSSGADLANVSSKAVIVLTYANWEGFYNECVRAYMRFLKECGGRIRDKDWMLLMAALHGEFESLKDRSHSDEARFAFVTALRIKIDSEFKDIGSSLVEARSNLNFQRMTWCFSVLGLDLTPLLKHRNKIDRELVLWRHSVAHGDQPDLTAMDINSHVDFAAGLLVQLADQFQAAMLQRV